MSKTFGYARISTMKQNIQRQIDNIKREYPNAIIVTEEYTGTKIARPAFNKLLKNVKAGDTIVFDEVSRMSRNAEDGFKLYEELFNKGVNLVFIKEPHINTATYKKALENNVSMTGTKLDYLIDGLNKFMMELAKEQIELAFKTAQAEVDFLHQRTSEGVQRAILNGKKVGGLTTKGTKLTTKKSIEMKSRIKELSKDFDGTNNDIEVMAITKLARNTYYKYKKEIANDLERGQE
jgi:DNA invertase Pin-like site-specific DNA recombinase